MSETIKSNVTELTGSLAFIPEAVWVDVSSACNLMYFTPLGIGLKRHQTLRRDVSS